MTLAVSHAEAEAVRRDSIQETALKFGICDFSRSATGSITRMGRR